MELLHNGTRSTRIFPSIAFSCQGDGSLRGQHSYLLSRLRRLHIFLVFVTSCHLSLVLPLLLSFFVLYLSLPLFLCSLSIMSTLQRQLLALNVNIDARNGDGLQAVDLTEVSVFDGDAAADYDEDENAVGVTVDADVAA